MELAGIVTITCKQTGLRAEIDFRQKPSFYGEYNSLVGKIIRMSNNQVSHVTPVIFLQHVTSIILTLSLLLFLAKNV